MGEQQHVNYCSFCGRSDTEVDVLIEAPVSFICDQCVEICHETVARLRREREESAAGLAGKGDGT